MSKKSNPLLTVLFSAFSLLYICPILVVLINSFKKKAYITKMPFNLPTGKAFVGLEKPIMKAYRKDCFVVVPPPRNDSCRF